MGLFDDVNYKMSCPNCGEIVDEFQTKTRIDGEYPSMEVIEFNEAFNFYGSCDKCHAFIEFTLKRAITIDDYDMLVDLSRVIKGEVK